MANIGKSVNNYPRKFVQNIINYNLSKKKIQIKEKTAKKHLSTLNMLSRKKNN